MKGVVLHGGYNTRLRHLTRAPPKHSLREALQTTVDWYTNNEWWWKPPATEQVLCPTPWKLKW